MPPPPKRANGVYSLRGLGTHGYAAMRGCLPIALIVALAPTAALEALLDAEALPNLMRRRWREIEKEPLRRTGA